LHAHEAEYPSQWIALLGDQLVAADTNHEVVMEALRRAGIRDALLVCTPPWLREEKPATEAARAEPTGGDGDGEPQRKG
jgi:hypothetical protein